MTHPYFVETHSGRAFLLCTDTQTAVCIRDIAAHLAKICRFAGACQQFYSVAQHSVHVSEACSSSPLAQLYGLLHDAHKAYVGDVPWPATQAEKALDDPELGSHRGAVSAYAARSILEALRLEWPTPARIIVEVNGADAQLLATERRDLMSNSGLEWQPLPDPLTRVIRPWPWPKAEELFLKRYVELTALAGVPDQLELNR